MKKKEQTLEDFLEENPNWKSAPDLLVSPPTKEELLSEYPDLDSHFISKAQDVMRGGFTRGAHYMLSRIRGSSHNMAEMLALQCRIGLDTDDTFFSGQKPLYDQFESQKHLDRFLNVSKKHGFTPSVQSTYFSNLARFPGDPEAFVSRAQGRSYMKNLLEKRGWSCEGGINVKGREPEKDPYALENRVALGEDIIQERAGKMIAENPALKNKNRKELRAEIIQNHGPQY